MRKRREGLIRGRNLRISQNNQRSPAALASAYLMRPHGRAFSLCFSWTDHSFCTQGKEDDK